MALTCPKCEKINLCNCKSCNPNEDKYGLVIILEDEQLYQCFSCGNKFSECDSLDFEWDRMHKDFKENITPDMCLIWIELSYGDRKKYEEKTSHGTYGFESAFFQHFGIRHKNCSKEDIERIKIQLKRDKKLNQLL